MPRAVIAFGSNIAPEKNVPEAMRRLARAVRVLVISNVYRTPPVGNPDDPPFLNGAVLVETESSAEELRERVLRRIESELGRVRTSDPNAPRTIDLDLVLYEGEEPSPDLFDYAHVAIPVAEVAPDWPVGEKQVAEIARGKKSKASSFEEEKAVTRAIRRFIDSPIR